MAERIVDGSQVGAQRSAADNEWPNGTLVWASLARYPYWPAYVLKGDENGKTYVRFLADNGRVSWISKGNLLHFSGLDDFRSYEKAQRNSATTKTQKEKVNRLFHFTLKIWTNAVAEANLLKFFADVDRNAFYDQFLDIMNSRTDEINILEERIISTAKMIFGDETVLPPADDFMAALKEILQLRPIHKVIPKRDKVILETVTSAVKAMPSAPLVPQDVKIKNQAKDLESIQEKEMLKSLDGKEKIRSFFIKNYPSHNLFRYLPKGAVCIACSHPGNTFQCSRCQNCYHKHCNQGAQIVIDLNLSDDENNNPQTDEVICRQCIDGKALSCFVCAKSTNELIVCGAKDCNRRYHAECLAEWPQSDLREISDRQLICPCHVCQTCDSVNPKKRNVVQNRQLIKCLRCPASYHRKTSCVPAGSELITDTWMICPRHRQYKPIHETWCFLCSKKGGTLICCEYCPTTVHSACIGREIGEKFVCETCESGKLPLYGEIIWAKFAHYKWWPAIIVPTWKIPSKVMTVQKRHHFCVCFFGKQKEFNWMSRDNVYQYEEGDLKFAKKSTKDENFRLALEEAEEFFKMSKETIAVYKEPKTRPPSYKKIKTNQVVAPAKMEPSDDMVHNCDCRFDDPNPCGINSDCINQATYVECSSDCPANQKCQNRRFQQAIYPKREVRNVNNVGWGLFVLEDISKGAFIIEYVGEVINYAEYSRRYHKLVDEKCDMFYFLHIETQNYIDAGRKGNDARFINHSCEPNCDVQKWSVNGFSRMGIFAKQHIPANTELTFNYVWQRGPIDDGITVCLCGTNSCTGYIGKKPAEETASSRASSSEMKSTKKTVKFSE